jgi:hypothetical protein
MQLGARIARRTDWRLPTPGGHDFAALLADKDVLDAATETDDGRARIDISLATRETMWSAGTSLPHPVSAPRVGAARRRQYAPLG